MARGKRARRCSAAPHVLSLIKWPWFMAGPRSGARRGGRDTGSGKTQGLGKRGGRPEAELFTWTRSVTWRCLVPPRAGRRRLSHAGPRQRWRWAIVVAEARSPSHGLGRRPPNQCGGTKARPVRQHRRMHASHKPRRARGVRRRSYSADQKGARPSAPPLRRASAGERQAQGCVRSGRVRRVVRGRVGGVGGFKYTASSTSAGVALGLHRGRGVPRLASTECVARGGERRPRPPIQGRTVHEGQKGGRPAAKGEGDECTGAVRPESKRRAWRRRRRLPAGRSGAGLLAAAGSAGRRPRA
jgi:hypothetical protein